jgi:hypothetical protein
MISGLERIKARFKCDIEDSLLSQIYAFLNSNKLTDDTSDYIEKSVEEEILESHIKKNDLFFNDLRFSIYLDEGAEQKVFFNDTESKVIKLNDAIFYVNWSQYFESLLVHNILFPETKYELLGFVKINEILYSAISQDYIRPTTKTNIEFVREYMISKGFTIKKRNDYIHAELGIIIEDLHEENVLVKDNTLFFIDTVIYLK